MLKRRKKEDLLPDAFFQTVFQTSPDAALVTRVCDGVIIHVNDGFCRITGYQREEALGKTTLELNLYCDKQDRDTFLRALAVDGVLETRPADFCRRDGTRYPALISARSFWSEGYEYVCASIRDVSEELRAAQERSELDEELRRLFETMSQGVVYQDAAGNILSANPAAERISGKSLAELKKRNTNAKEWNVLREDGTPLTEHESPVEIALRTGQACGPCILGLYNDKIGDHVWLKMVATPLFRAAERTPYQIYVVMEDITAQRKAQRNYQLLFQEMMDAFTLNEIILDEDGKPINYRFLAVNPAFERMLGRSASEIVGKTVRQVLPQTKQSWIDTFGRVALGGEPITFQFFAEELDQYFNVSAYRPAPMQFACVITDITSSIRFQQEKDRAQEQINRLAHICDVAPSSILVYDDDAKILYANHYTAKMHGYSKEELLTMHVYDIAMVTNSRMIQDNIPRVREKGDVVMRRTGLKRDKTPIPLLIYTCPIDWDRQSAILSIGVDLTEQLKTEQILQESLSQNRRILENLQDGFFRADLDGNFFMINPRMAHIYGYDTVEEMLPTSAKQMYADLQDRVNLFERLSQQEHVTSFVCKGVKRDGSFIWVSMHMQYLRDSEGNIIGTEGLIRDITSRRKLEKEFENQHQALLETNAVLQKRLEQSINAISKIGELRDVYTAGHQRRVQQLACEIGLRCGMSQEEITNLSYGALIHDIGKIYVATDILNKPGKITNLEYQILQTHAEYSYHIAQEMDLPPVILAMVLQHHERLDGSGYPNHLKDDQITLEGRILAVADVVEAMTSHRPYRPALGLDAALAEILAGRGTKFDAQIVDLCVALFREEGFVFQADPVT